jgi:two-component sensor histidine kinase
MSMPEEPARSVDDLLSSPEVARAVENEEFKRFLDHMPFAIAVSKGKNGEERIVYGNPRFEELTGIASPAIQGRDWSVLDGFMHEDDGGLKLGRAVSEGADFLGTFTSAGQEQEPMLLEAYASLIEKEDGTENYRVAAFVSVTGRERSQREEFQRQIRDKDLLLREIQHRVKNNLQLIIALIRLEARTGRDGVKTVDIDRLAGRIEAVRVLYSSLEGPSQGQEIDLGQYVGQIAAAAMASYAIEGIRLELHADCCPISINIALPTGLVVNEAMTNAFKYAFVGRDAGTITVRCVQADEGYVVTVADDGIGLPTGLEWPEPGKLSALILQSLRENAKARFTLDTEPGQGTRVEILIRTPALKVH